MTSELESMASLQYQTSYEFLMLVVIIGDRREEKFEIVVYDSTASQYVETF